MKTNLDRKLAVICKYIGPSNVKGSRVKMTLPIWKKSKVISYNHELDNISDMAAAWLAENGVEVEAECSLGASEDMLVVNHSQIALVRAAFGLEA
jgi:hypothetical protein